MEDTIYRQQAIDAVNTWFELYVVNRTTANAVSIQDMLRALPSAQPQRKGHWVYAGTDFHTGDDWYTCSECEAIDEYYMSPYCWHCGCRMEGDDE